MFKEEHWIGEWNVWGLCLLVLPDKSPYDNIKKQYCDVLLNGVKPRMTLYEYFTKVSLYTLEGLQKLMEFKERQYILDNHGPLTFDSASKSENDHVEDEPMDLEENGGKELNPEPVEIYLFMLSSNSEVGDLDQDEVSSGQVKEEPMTPYFDEDCEDDSEGEHDVPGDEDFHLGHTRKVETRQMILVLTSHCGSLSFVLFFSMFQRISS